MKAYWTDEWKKKVPPGTTGVLVGLSSKADSCVGGGPSQKVDCGWSQRINHHHTHVQEMGYTCCIPCVKTLIINDGIISNHSLVHKVFFWGWSNVCVSFGKSMLPERSVQRSRLQAAWRPGWHFWWFRASGIRHSCWSESHQVHIQHTHLLRLCRCTSCIFVRTRFADFHWDFAAVHNTQKNQIIPPQTTINVFDLVANLLYLNSTDNSWGILEEAARHQTQQQGRAKSNNQSNLWIPTLEQSHRLTGSMQQWIDEVIQTKRASRHVLNQLSKCQDCYYIKHWMHFNLNVIRSQNFVFTIYILLYYT